MSWLEFIRTLWPIAVVITPIITGAGFLYLKTQFLTKADLDTAKTEILGKIERHEERLATGSDKLADLDRRVAVVEEDCDSSPSKSELNQAMTVLGGRMSGVESGLRGVERQVSTQHDYLRTLVERGLK